MTADPVRVEFRDGHPVLVLATSDLIEELCAVVDRANRQRLYSGGLPMVSAGPFVKKSRIALAIYQMVAQKQPVDDSATTPTGQWMTTKEAARLLGITEQAITKKARAGRITARKAGGCWWVHIEEVTHAIP